MGQIAAKFAGFEDLKKDVESLKTAAELLRGVTGQLGGKAAMITDGFNKLKQAKATMDSQVGNVMSTVNQVSGNTQGLLSKISEVETKLDDLKKKAGQAQQAMQMGKKLQSGDIAGGLNDLKEKGIGGFKVPTFGF